MSVFGPFYPADLQAAVNHAERFTRVVARRRSGFPRHHRAPIAVDDRSDLELWLVGRCEEIVVMVGDIVDDWRAGRTPSRRAAILVDRYVLALHRGLASFTREGEVPACCKPCDPTVDLDADVVARATGA